MLRSRMRELPQGAGALGSERISEGRLVRPKRDKNEDDVLGGKGFS